MEKMTRGFLWTIAGLLWCYIIYRAFTQAILQDEAYSYYLIKTHYWRAMPGSANTHWLNTIFMRLFLWLPGPDDPWKLRLLSVGCWPVFAFSVIRFSAYCRNRWIGIAFFMAAVLNPYLVFFFSQGRGYAPGCTFLMLSIWLATRALHKPAISPAQWWPVFFTASLAVLSNFSFFYCYMAMTIIYVLHLLAQKKGNLLLRRSAGGWWLLVAVTFVFSIGSLLFMKTQGSLDHGGRAGLVESMISSLMVNGSYPGFAASWYTVAGIVVFIVLLLLFVWACYAYYRSGTLTPFALPVFICTGVVFFNLVFHVLFGTLYLLDRTALVIYLPLVAGVAGMWDELLFLLKNKIFRIFSSAFVLLLVGLFGYNFYKAYSPDRFAEWPIQGDTKKCLDQLAALNAKNVGMSVWQRDIMQNYYSLAFPEKYHFSYTRIREGDTMSSFDYLLVTLPHPDTPKIPGGWKVVASYPGSGAVILGKE